MRLIHPGRRALIAGFAALAVAGATGAAVGVAATSGAAQPPSGASLDAASVASPSTAHAGSGKARLALVRLLVRETVKETGLSRATVVKDLRAGQTLDQIAGSNAGAVSSDALSLVRGRLDRAVAGHRITPAQEQTRLNTVEAAITQLMGENLAARLPAHSHSA